MQPAWPSTARPAPSPRWLMMPVRGSCGRAEIGPLAEIALQFGEEPGHGMGVMPDVGAGAFAAADAFPAVEPARREAVAGGRGQDRRVRVACDRGTSRASVESYQVSCQSRVWAWSAGEVRRHVLGHGGGTSETAWRKIGRRP